MSHKNTIFTAALLTAGALVASVTGCELIASVDRSKIAGTGGGGQSGTGGTTSTTTTTTTTTTTSTGGTGGTGGSMCGAAMTCGTPADCPAQQSECKTNTCSAMGCCGTSDVANGVPTMNGQTPGDCMQQVCDGSGNAIMVNDDADVPADDGNPCTSEACSNGVPSHPATQPSPNVCTINGGGMGVCGDPAGAAKATCVQCNVTADCLTAGDFCKVATNTCVAGHCGDGIKDSDETDVDCGGSCGASCEYTPTQQACLVNGDCIGGDCVGAGAADAGMEGLCTKPTCGDGVADGNETDVDCGGSGFMGAMECSPCADNMNKKCALNSDCAGGFCDQTVSPHVCKTPTCSDGQKNGMETGIDCGGALCDGQGKTCAVGLGCVNANDCMSGFCMGGTTCALKPLGTPCGSGAECVAPSACVDGVCCNSACNGTCVACTAAQQVAGGMDGTCGQALNGTDPHGTCPVQVPLVCGNTAQLCQAGACAVVAAGTTCRASAGVCDVAETCPGGGAACPANGFVAAGTQCRAAQDVCDIAADCTGNAAACPANGFKASNVVCRASAGICDVAENCTGNAAACPADAVVSAGTVCRPSAGLCDVAEDCDGVNVTCPADAFQGAGTVCRASAGICDVAEDCTGNSAACPADGFMAAGTVCRASAGICDVAEDCTGASAACPADGFMAAGTVCRASAGVCDVAEDCTGASASCPADGFVAAGTVCRAAVGSCDIPEDCTGASASCPADVIVAKDMTSATCNGNDVCDGVAGLSTDCLLASGQPCSMDSQCADGSCVGGTTCN